MVSVRLGLITFSGAHTLSHLTVLGLALTLTLTLGSYCNSLLLLGAKVYEPPFSDANACYD